MAKLPIRGVLFDLDQTLTDRARSVELVAEKMLAAFPTHCPLLTARMIRDIILQLDKGGYRKRDEFSVLMVEALKTDLPARELETWWRANFPRCAIEATGAKHVLAELHRRGVRLGIVTNGTSSSQNAKIDVLGFRPYLSSIQISEAAGVEKPNAEIFLRALREMSLAPGETLFVGDHPINDVQAARAVGMHAAWVSGMFAWPPELPAPEWVTTALDQILDFVADKSD